MDRECGNSHLTFKIDAGMVRFSHLQPDIYDGDPHDPDRYITLVRGVPAKLLMNVYSSMISFNILPVYPQFNDDSTLKTPRAPSYPYVYGHDAPGLRMRKERDDFL